MIGIDQDLLELTIVTRDLESDLEEIGQFEELCTILRQFSVQATELMGFKHQVQVHAGQLKVAIIGDFSAGKSTLINSLIGEEICPVNAKPTTSSLTRFRWGVEKKVYRVERGVESEISFDQYTSMVQHGDDGTKTRAFEFIVEYPYDALRDLEIVDTPGFGNSQNDQDTELTKGHAAQADVILYLTDIVKGEIGEDSLKIMREIKSRQTQKGAWLLILNKADQKPPKARERIMNKHRAALADIFDEVVPYSAHWAMQMNPKSQGYWVYQLQDDILRRAHEGQNQISMQTQSTRKEHKLVLDEGREILIALNGTDFVVSAEEMQQKFVTFSQKKDLFFKNMLMERTTGFVTHGTELITYCQTQLKQLDSEENRNEVERLSGQIWELIAEVVSETEPQDRDLILSECSSRFHAKELTNEEKSYFFTAYGAHTLGNPKGLAEKLTANKSGLKGKIRIRLEHNQLYQEDVFENCFMSLNEELNRSMMAAVYQVLRHSDSSWNVDTWPVWPDDGFPSKCLIAVFDNLEEARSNKRNNLNVLSELIGDRYMELLIGDVRDVTLKYASQLTGAQLQNHGALVERSEFALDKVKEMSDLLRKIDRG